MPQYTYDIVLQTQLGDKFGKMILAIDNGNLSGSLSVLGYSMPCSGKMDDAGHCVICGQLQTFMSLIDYSGTGHADSKSVDFQLISNHTNRFHLYGTFCKEEVKQQDESM